jgi:hypothetical protein
MKIITEEDLLQLFLKKNKKSAMIFLKTNAVQKTKKTSRTTSQTLQEVFGTEKIIKVSEIPVQINAIYENAVNNRLEKTGEEKDFESGLLRYGKYVEDSRCLIVDGEKKYLRVYQTNSKLGKESAYFKENGEEISGKLLETLKKDFLDIKPEFVKSQGLSYEDSCKPTNYLLGNIRGVTMDEETFEVI